MAFAWSQADSVMDSLGVWVFTSSSSLIAMNDCLKARELQPTRAKNPESLEADTSSGASSQMDPLLAIWAGTNNIRNSRKKPVI